MSHTDSKSFVKIPYPLSCKSIFNVHRLWSIKYIFEYAQALKENKKRLT